MTLDSLLPTIQRITTQPCLEPRRPNGTGCPGWM
jgi:hypothetical protein